MLKYLWTVTQDLFSTVTLVISYLLVNVTVYSVFHSATLPVAVLSSTAKSSSFSSSVPPVSSAFWNVKPAASAPSVKV